jgi:hypothetical protein
VGDSDLAKRQGPHSSRLPTASASETVGRTFAYHAAVRPTRACACRIVCAMSVTNH